MKYNIQKDRYLYAINHEHVEWLPRNGFPNSTQQKDLTAKATPSQDYERTRVRETLSQVRLHRYSHETMLAYMLSMGKCNSSRHPHETVLHQLVEWLC